MNPVRQQLLRLLSISLTPMTPKMLADKLTISPSSVQYHIKKLMSLELIELDHQKIINGITASYYKAPAVIVQVGTDRTDDTDHQRAVILQDAVSSVFDGFKKKAKLRKEQQSNNGQGLSNQWGDVLTGVVHLQKTESEELLKMITNYIEQHSTPSFNSAPWEYAMILYNAKDDPCE